MAACRADDTLRGLCERGGFKDFNDNKDIKDARERDKSARSAGGEREGFTAFHPRGTR